jgi:dCTP deaminase
MILSGRDIEWYIQSGKLKIDPVTPEQFQQNGIDLILESVNDSPARFDCGKFYLGGTRETLTIPDDLMAFVELRSSWARTGLLLPPTIVDAGFHGNLTLEIVAFRDMTVPYGKRFAHLIFAKLTSPSTPYQGKYQGQSGITGPRPDKE